MKSFLFFLSFIISILSFAQENEIYGNGVFNFEQKTNQRIFTEDTRVRENPTSSSPILDSLKANTTITILQKDKNVTVLGQRFSHWYKIKYTKEGKQSEGYIWGGNIAMQYLSKNGFEVHCFAQKINKDEIIKIGGIPHKIPRILRRGV